MENYTTHNIIIATSYHGTDDINLMLIGASVLFIVGWALVKVIGKLFKID